MAKEENQKNTWKDAHLKILLSGFCASGLLIVISASVISNKLPFIMKDGQICFEFFLFFAVMITSSVAAGIFGVKFLERLSNPDENW